MYVGVLVFGVVYFGVVYVGLLLVGVVYVGGVYAGELHVEVVHVEVVHVRVLLKLVTIREMQSIVDSRYTIVNLVRGVVCLDTSCIYVTHLTKIRLMSIFLHFEWHIPLERVK